jgi:tRNA(fMet)-specific endonuclease VapC
MAPLYLLDTNIVGYFVRSNPPEVKIRLMQERMENLAVSVVTAAELRYWVSRRPERSRLRVLIDDFLVKVQTLPLELAAAEIYGELKVQLQQMGKPIAEFDLLIACHALALNVTLVTHDQAFQQIPGLVTEDWVAQSI